MRIFPSGIDMRASASFDRPSLVMSRRTRAVSLTRLPKAEEAQPNLRADLRCFASGNVLAQYLWIRGGSVIGSGLFIPNPGICNCEGSAHSSPSRSSCPKPKGKLCASTFKRTRDGTKSLKGVARTSHIKVEDIGSFFHLKTYMLRCWGICSCRDFPGSGSPVPCTRPNSCLLAAPRTPC